MTRPASRTRRSQKLAVDAARRSEACATTSASSATRNASISSRGPQGPIRQPTCCRRPTRRGWSRTPIDPDDFNGTTVVEWAHVSDIGQWELTVELNYQSLMLEDEGYAFALVSAEEGGVCDESPKGCTPTSLKMADPERYGSLDHPGDAYAFDIFSQALQAIKFPNDVPTRGPRPRDRDRGGVPTVDRQVLAGGPSEPRGVHLAVQHLRPAQRLPRQRCRRCGTGQPMASSSMRPHRATSRPTECPPCTTLTSPPSDASRRPTATITSPGRSSVPRTLIGGRRITSVSHHG